MVQEKIATRVPMANDTWRGDARLYRLDPPIAQRDWMEDEDDVVYEYVVVSANVIPFTGPETYIFGSNENGDPSKMQELQGSFRGGLDHAEALEAAGYTLTESEPEVDKATLADRAVQDEEATLAALPEESRKLFMDIKQRNTERGEM